MTLDRTDIRAALDHRITAAGLDDPANIPAPHQVPLVGGPSGNRSRSRRVLAAAAALVLVGGGGLAFAIAARGHDRPGSVVVPATTSADPSTTTTTDPRPSLPPPWPKLETRAPSRLPGKAATSKEEFEAELPALDASSRADVARTGRFDVIDQLTGDLVSVDVQQYSAQFQHVMAWLRAHRAALPGFGPATVEDPIAVFTDGSFRLVYRSDLDCSPLPDGRTPPACAAPN